MSTVVRGLSFILHTEFLLIFCNSGGPGGEWPARRVSSAARGPTSDRGIFIEVQWSRKIDALSPTIHDIRGYYAHHKEGPINIRFVQQTVDTMSSAFAQDNLEQYFNVLLESLPRWKSIRLWAPYVPRQSFVGKIFPDARLLEEVFIEGPPSVDIPVTCQLLSSCWGVAPSLKTFNLITTNDLFGSMMINPRLYIPLRTVTRIQLCNKLSILECSEVLLHAPNLIECLFDNVTASVAVLKQIRCKSLEKLTLHANHEDVRLGKPINLRMLFENLKASDLKDVELTLITFGEQEQHAFINFLQRSRCGLQALKLDGIAITEQQLRSILHLVSSSLRVLEVHPHLHGSRPLPQSPMTSVTNTGQNRILCPQLEMFSISDTTVSSFSEDMILNLLSGRNMKMCRVRPDGQGKRGSKILDLIEHVRKRLGLKVLDGDNQECAQVWDEQKSSVVSSKLKSPDLSCESFAVLLYTHK